MSSSAKAKRRIQKEFEELQGESSLTNVTAGPAEDNIFNWSGTISGPEGTPYEGGLFFVSIKFPSNYPFRPPQIKFRTRIWHCNINANGSICLDILKDQWSPALTIVKVLISLCSLLNEPNPDDPLSIPAAEELRRSKEEYNEHARRWTQLYAGGGGEGGSADAEESGY